MQYFVPMCKYLENIFLSEKYTDTSSCLCFEMTYLYRASWKIIQVELHRPAALTTREAIVALPQKFWTERKCSSNLAKVWFLHFYMFKLAKQLLLSTSFTTCHCSLSQPFHHLGHDHSWRPKHNAKKSLKETSIWPAISRSINIIGWGV